MYFSFAFLRQTKTNLIQRVVSCIGCEKALKLFRDTKEVQLHGGMWTKDNQRRYTICQSYVKNQNHSQSPLKPSVYFEPNSCVLLRFFSFYVTVSRQSIKCNISCNSIKVLYFFFLKGKLKGTFPRKGHSRDTFL